MPLPKKPRLLLVSLAILIADLLSKAWITANFDLYESRSIIAGFFSLTHVENRGVAFGFLSFLGDAGPPALIAAGAVALIVVGLYFRQTPNQQTLLLVALALILGGAVGNLVDRAAHGSVTDFLDVYFRSYHWYTFNVADSAISVGIGLMLLDLLRERRRPNAER